MKRRLLTAATLFAALAAKAAPNDDYAYAWPLQTEGDSAAWQVELTPEVYAAITRADLGDIQVINAAGEAVPIAPQPVPIASTTRENLVTPPLFALPATAVNAPNASDDAIRMNIQRAPDGRLQVLDLSSSAAPRGETRKPPRDWLVDASTIREPLAGIHVDWESAPGTAGNMTPQFSVSASDDLQQWRSLVANASLLHLEQDGNTLDRHEIPFAGIRAAYLRVRRLDSGPELPALDVKVRTVSHSTAAQAGRQWLQATLDGGDTHHLDAAHLPQTDGTSVVAYRYHLPAPLAIEMIRVGLADDNSLARLSVLSHARGPNEKSPWTQRMNGIAFRLHQGDAIVDNDDFAVLAGAREQDWRIEVTTPLAHAPTLSVAYRPDRFVFLAQGGGPYRLVAGSARTHRGEYPVETALAPLRAKLGKDWQPPLAALGQRETLQGERALTAAPPAPKPFDWRGAMLWIVLVGAAALVGGLALSLLRKPGTNKAP
jgi:hypothetical protein